MGGLRLPWLGLRPRLSISTVNLSAEWVKKSVYKIKYKSSDNFSEHYSQRFKMSRKKASV